MPSLKELLSYCKMLSNYSRTKILIALYHSKSNTLKFSELKEKLGYSSFRQSFHLTKLINSGFVEVIPRTEGSRLLNTFKLTEKTKWVMDSLGLSQLLESKSSQSLSSNESPINVRVKQMLDSLD